MVLNSTNQLTEEEAAIYDRQIRLWGLESQNRLKQCQILLVGMTSLGCEIAKNLVLAGIAGLTIIDDNLVTEEDIKTNFLVKSECLGMRLSEAVLPRAQELNPMVRIRSISLPTTNMNELLEEFTMVILTLPNIDKWFTFSDTVAQMEQNNAPCLICAFTVGLYGAAFVDLGIHDFVAEDVVLKKVSLDKQNSPEKSSGSTEIVYAKKTYKYSRLPEALTPSWINNDSPGINTKHITKGFLLLQTLRECLSDKIHLEPHSLKEHWKKTADRLGVPETLLADDQLYCCCVGPLGQIPAVDAVLGGVVAQEVVRAVTRKGAPHGNWYFMDGNQCSVTTDWLPELNEIIV